MRFKFPAFVQPPRLRAACLAPLTSPRRAAASAPRWVHSGWPVSRLRPGQSPPSRQVPAPRVAQTADLRLLQGSLRSPWSAPPVPLFLDQCAILFSVFYLQREKALRRCCSSVSRNISDDLWRRLLYVQVRCCPLLPFSTFFCPSHLCSCSYSTVNHSFP